MNKKSSNTIFPQEEIDRIKSEQPTYLDLGYNKQLVRKEVIEEREKADKRLMEQEEHEEKMLLLKLQQQNQLQQGKQALVKNKIIFNSSTGDIIYFNKNNRKYSFGFSPKTNPYLLLLFFCQNPGKIYSAKDTAQCLKKPRQGGEDSTNDRRVRDTIGQIRKKLRLSEKDDIFIVDNGWFGIKYNAELEI